MSGRAAPCGAPPLIPSRAHSQMGPEPPVCTGPPVIDLLVVGREECYCYVHPAYTCTQLQAGRWITATQNTHACQTPPGYGSVRFPSMYGAAPGEHMSTHHIIMLMVQTGSTDVDIWFGIVPTDAEVGVTQQHSCTAAAQQHSTAPPTPWP